MTEQLELFNPYHDNLGRFASKTGGAAKSKVKAARARWKKVPTRQKVALAVAGAAAAAAITSEVAYQKRKRTNYKDILADGRMFGSFSEDQKGHERNYKIAKMFQGQVDLVEKTFGKKADLKGVDITSGFTANVNEVDLFSPYEGKFGPHAKRAFFKDLGASVLYMQSKVFKNGNGWYTENGYMSINHGGDAQNTKSIMTHELIHSLTPKDKIFGTFADISFMEGVTEYAARKLTPALTRRQKVAQSLYYENEVKVAGKAIKEAAAKYYGGDEIKTISNFLGIEPEIKLAEVRGLVIPDNYVPDKMSEIRSAIAAIMRGYARDQEFDIFFNALEEELVKDGVKLEEYIDDLELFNPYHDALGRFARKAGGAAVDAAKKHLNKSPSAQGEDIDRAKGAVKKYGGQTGEYIAGVWEYPGDFNQTKKLNKEYSKMLVGGTNNPKIRMCSSFECMGKAAGNDWRKRGFDPENNVAFYKPDTNSLVFGPNAHAMRKNYPDDYKWIVAHETTHTRKRLDTGKQINIASQRHAHWEEGLTECISWGMVQKKSKKPVDIVSPYGNQMEAVAKFARYSSGGDRKKAWNLVTQAHLRNGSSKIIDDLDTVTGGELSRDLAQGTGSFEHTNWLMGSGRDDLPETFEERSVSEKRKENMRLMIQSETQKYDMLGIDIGLDEDEEDGEEMKLKFRDEIHDIEILEEDGEAAIVRINGKILQVDYLDLCEQLDLYNPYHDAMGRFASKTGTFAKGFVKGASRHIEETAKNPNTYKAAAVIGGAVAVNKIRYNKDVKARAMAAADEALESVPKHMRAENPKVQLHSTIAGYSRGKVLLASSLGYNRLGTGKLHISPWAYRSLGRADGEMTDAFKKNKDMAKLVVVHESLHSRQRDGKLNFLGARNKIGIEEGIVDTLSERYAKTQSLSGYTSYRDGMTKIAMKLNDNDRAKAVKWMEDSHKRFIGPKDIAQQLSEKTGQRVGWRDVTKYVAKDNSWYSRTFRNGKLDKVLGSKSGFASQFNKDVVPKRGSRYMTDYGEGISLLTGTAELFAAGYLVRKARGIVWAGVVGGAQELWWEKRVERARDRLEYSDAEDVIMLGMDPMDKIDLEATIQSLAVVDDEHIDKWLIQVSKDARMAGVDEDEAMFAIHNILTSAQQLREAYDEMDDEEIAAINSEDEEDEGEED